MKNDGMRERDFTAVIKDLVSTVALESDIIDRLFRLLSMHISAEELGSLPEMPMMLEAARLKRGLGITDEPCTGETCIGEGGENVH